jgi:hypothetical protein
MPIITIMMAAIMTTFGRYGATNKSHNIGMKCFFLFSFSEDIKHPNPFLHNILHPFSLKQYLMAFGTFKYFNKMLNNLKIYSCQINIATLVGFSAKVIFNSFL